MIVKLGSSSPPSTVCKCESSLLHNCLIRNGVFIPHGHYLNGYIILFLYSMMCSSGYFSLGSEASCTVCPAGSSCASSSDPPIPCDLGMYSSEGSINCTWCPAGYQCPTTSGKLYLVPLIDSYWYLNVSHCAFFTYKSKLTFHVTPYNSISECSIICVKVL